MKIHSDFRFQSSRPPQAPKDDSPANFWTEPAYYQKDEGCFRVRKIVIYERQPELCKLAKGAVAGALGCALPYAAGAPAALRVLGGIAGLAVGYAFWGGDRRLAV